MPVRAVCPRCQQGWVVDRFVAATGERWWVCEECDAVWNVLERLRAPGFEDLSGMLRASGLPESWDQLRPPAPADPEPADELAGAFDRSQDPDPAVRVRAVATMAPAVLSGDAGTRITTLLRDPDPDVAAAAAAGLMRFGDEASLERAVRSAVQA